VSGSSALWILYTCLEVLKVLELELTSVLSALVDCATHVCVAFPIEFGASIVENPYFIECVSVG
jgi:hypothetical protein